MVSVGPVDVEVYLPDVGGVEASSNLRYRLFRNCVTLLKTTLVTFFNVVKGWKIMFTCKVDKCVQYLVYVFNLANKLKFLPQIVNAQLCTLLSFGSLTLFKSFFGH